ncbi:MAG: hypothetical protein ACR2LL_10045 [Nitrosopumilus sp.]|uniref:hypothetical protein n=1 Tax=Nitrosopumilus sp. TaxID=2024843 RepID=UPI00292D7A42|nr:hypothetical protein [Nitrosopumilus sp.]
MTDWTKKNNEEDKFIEWMNSDKEKHNKNYRPKKFKKQNKTKKIIFLGIIVTIFIIVIAMISNNNEFNSEKYFYILDYRLNKSPLFCAKDFSDPIFPNVNSVVIQKTKESVEDWQNKIEIYTKTDGDWKFEFKAIPEKSSFSEFGCDATITFEQTPPIQREQTRGETALSHYGFSDVVIFYLDPRSKDKIDPNLEMVIRHEIGHVLGLGHPIFEGMYDEIPFYKEGEEIFSRSIMVTPEIYPFLPKDMKYSITDYDVRAVVNLYGGGISNTPIFFGYLNYVIIAIVLFSIAVFVSKKLK